MGSRDIFFFILIFFIYFFLSSALMEWLCPVPRLLTLAVHVLL